MAPHPSVESPLSIAKTTRQRKTTFDIYDVDNKIPIYCMFKDIQVATKQWAYVSQQGNIQNKMQFNKAILIASWAKNNIF